ncbi:MAG: protease modulator HflC [Verrucomicrobia bacterium]|nr:protease modulator HflC [Verrucomicrobiota bacterium]
MNKFRLTSCFAIVLFLIVAIVLSLSCYTVDMTEQVIITRFGKPIGETIDTAGLRFKVPFIDEVNRFEKRIMAWDGQANEMPTKDKTYILVDTYARWKIVDARAFFENLRDERRALSRLDDILGSETRNTIARHKLIEVIRTTKDREPERPEGLSSGLSGNVAVLPPITKGRVVLEKEILERSKGKVKKFGIELLDLRFKRINYNETVRRRIYERMISERAQIAELFRSEGAGEAAKILGNMEKELKSISSSAYKKIQITKGDADAKAIKIYAEAYDQDAASKSFYEFTRTMETFENTLGNDTMLILSTNSDLFKYLKGLDSDE